MVIGIDISQIVYEGTGVSRYVKNLVRTLIASDTTNEYILFGSSLRRQIAFDEYLQSFQDQKNVRLVTFPFPPTMLDFLWNRLHIIPIEWLIGTIDIFWSSDWTQPPLTRAKGMTTIHDVSFLRFPESFPSSIIDVQKRRLAQAFKTCSVFLCDSLATKKDIMRNYKIAEQKIYVIYPGVTK